MELVFIFSWLETDPLALSFTGYCYSRFLRIPYILFYLTLCLTFYINNVDRSCTQICHMSSLSQTVNDTT